jgi:ACS family glucarate transporter-like MFS transporter
MGTIYSAFLLSYTLMMTPGGALADRFGGRRVLTIAGLGAALFTGLTAVSGPQGLGAYLGVIPAFIAMRLAFGVCASPLYPSTGRIAAAWIPPSGQARVQAIIMSGAAVGSAIAPVLFSRLIASYGWRGAFWIAAALTAVLIGIWYAWVGDRPTGQAPPARQSAASTAASWRALIGDRHLLLLTGSYFALNYFEYIFYYWIYYYFGEIRHMPQEQSAYATTVIFITMAVMTPLGGWVSDWMRSRFGPSRGARIVPIGAMAASAALLYIGASGLSVFLTVALLSLAVGCSMAPEGTFWSTAIHMGGKQVGAACGFMNFGGNVGGMLAPILTPMIAQRFGWTVGLSFASLIVLLGMLAWLVLEPTHQVRDT